MKFKTLSLIFLSFLLFFPACSKKKQEKLKVYNTEAFAYDLGNKNWEVDATTRVQGFIQKEENNLYKASLAYDIDIITPKGNTIKSIISKIADKQKKEKMTDIGIDAQVNLDSTYALGNYKIVIRVKDVYSGKTSESTANFKLNN